MNEILKYVLPSLPLPLALLLLLLFVPEKIEKWSALLWKLLANIFRAAHKRYVKHDLQGRVNDFVKRLRRQVPSVGDTKLRIEWVDPSTPRKSFIEGDEVILRLRRDDPMDHNFVHGSYLFVSETLLKKAKRYISPSQREALDLFACTKLLEEEKPAVLSVFLGEYLHPGTDERRSKVAIYVDDFGIIDKGGLFFPVLLQELEYLGEKVFGRRQDNVIIGEVDDLVDFLKPIATRTVGDESDLNFDGNYCRFALVIVGKRYKLLTSIDPYVKFIRNVLGRNEIETIYILSRLENKERVEEICQRIADMYDRARRLEFSSFLKYPDRRERALQYLVVMRKKGIAVIQASE